MNDPIRPPETAIPKTRTFKITQFFIVRILIALLFLTVGGAINFGQKTLLVHFGISELALIQVYRLLFAISIMYFFYYLYVRLIEKRSASEISLRGAAGNLAAGMGIGFALISVQVLFLGVTGYYKVSGFNFSTELFEILKLSLLAGFIEELLMREIIFRLLEKGLGSWIAIILSSLMFGFGHFNNEGATLMTSIAVMLEAGPLTALVFILTRRLWMVVGLHFAWNFTLGGIYGLTVSGINTVGILESRLAGPELLTGGAFGIEAALPAIILCLAVSMIFVRTAARKKLFIKAPWNRN